MNFQNFDIDRFVENTLAEDLGDAGDITSAAVIPADARFTGVMDSRDAIVVAGLPIAEAFFRALDSEVRIERLVEDGARVAAGADLLRLEGNARALLTAERSALNTVQHLSGVATLTAPMPTSCSARARRCSTRARRCPACACWRNMRRGWAARPITAWACGTRR